MTDTQQTRWTATLTAPGIDTCETFEGLCDNGDKDAWTQARDHLVDGALDDLDSPLAETLSTLLCDADPQEAVSFSHAGITLTLLAEAQDGRGPHRVERSMPDTVLTRADGTPVATFHVTDDWDEDEAETIDEAEAERLARVCARALDRDAGTPRRYTVSEFDGSTLQVIATDSEGNAYEYCTVSAREDEDDIGPARDRARSIAEALAG